SSSQYRNEMSEVSSWNISLIFISYTVERHISPFYCLSHFLSLVHHFKIFRLRIDHNSNFSCII
ncbi:hypothetical protein L9F63_019893, partial [Diploptera punctata]